MAPSLCFCKRQRCTSSYAMAKVEAKHANCSVFGCSDEHRTLFTVSASEEMRAVDLLIYLLYIAVYAATQI